MKNYRKQVSLQLFLIRLENPVFVFVYLLAWHILAQLCRYGGAAGRVPMLMLCAFFFGMYLFRYFKERADFLESEIPHFVFTGAKVENDGILCSSKDENTEYGFSFEEIKKVKKTRKYLCFFLKGKRFVIIDKQKMPEYDLEFLLLNISRINPFKKVNIQILLYIALLFITVNGCVNVMESASHLNGKLSWALLDLKQKRYVNLSEDNLYKAGLDGIFEDLDKALSLPDNIMISAGFNLHFKKDGTIETFDMMLAGYNAHCHYVKSYLITYDREKSSKIIVYVQDNKTEEYEEEKNFLTLVEMCKKIPFQSAAKDLEKEGGKEFAMLSYGERSFHYDTSGIRYLDKEGNIEIPAMAAEEIEGFSVSVFVPGKEQEILPHRYMYCEDVTKQVNVTGKDTNSLQTENSYSPQKEGESLTTEQKEQERIEKKQVKDTGAQWSLQDYINPALYGEAEETSNTYRCRHGIELYIITQMDYQLYGESKAIKKINEQLKEDKTIFLGNSLARAEEILEKSEDSPCICKKYEGVNGFYNRGYSLYLINRIVYIDRDIIEIQISRVVSDTEEKTDQRGMLLFSLQTGEPLELSDILDKPEKEIKEIINESFEKTQGFYEFADGATAADIWFGNQSRCGFYITKTGIAFTFGKGVFPNQENRWGDIEAEALYKFSK